MTRQPDISATSRFWGEKHIVRNSHAVLTTVDPVDAFTRDAEKLFRKSVIDMRPRHAVRREAVAKVVAKWFTEREDEFRPDIDHIQPRGSYIPRPDRVITSETFWNR